MFPESTIRIWFSWECLIAYFIVPRPFTGYLAVAFILAASFLLVKDALSQLKSGARVAAIIYTVVRAGLFSWVLIVMQSHANALASVGPIPGHHFTGAGIQTQMIGATLSALGWIINQSVRVPAGFRPQPVLSLKRMLHLATVSAFCLFVAMVPGMYVVGIAAVIIMLGCYVADAYLQHVDRELAEAEGG